MTANRQPVFGKTPINLTLRMRQSSNSLQPLTHCRFCAAQIEGSLQIHPVLRRLAERLGKAQGQFSGNGARAFDDVRHTHRRHANALGEGGLRHSKIVQYLRQKSAGMNRRHSALGHISDVGEVQACKIVAKNAHGVNPLVVVDNFNVPCMAITPDKADAPLIVNADAVLPLPITGKLFEAIRRGRKQVIKAFSSVKLSQSHSSALRDGWRQAAHEMTGKQCGGFSAGKGLNHASHRKQFVYDNQAVRYRLATTRNPSHNPPIAHLCANGFGDPNIEADKPPAGGIFTSVFHTLRVLSMAGGCGACSRMAGSSMPVRQPRILPASPFGDGAVGLIAHRGNAHVC